MKHRHAGVMSIVLRPVHSAQVESQPQVLMAPYHDAFRACVGKPAGGYSESMGRTKSPDRSFGSNQVDFGGMISPASAIAISSAMLVG